jgi:hypothetical protein
LNTFLDTSNQEELNMALFEAQDEEHWEIVNDLILKGAKR